MSVDFTAIDFETANGFRGSACSVGVVKVRNSRVVETANWLMRPPEGFDHFDPRNVQIHGITPDMVKDAPRFGELYTPLMNFVGNDILVAHNAAFDVGVIRSAAEMSELNVDPRTFACTVILSRKTYDLPSYSLPFVAEAAGAPLENHHEALADATACANIMMDIAYRQNAADIPAVHQSLRVSLGHAEGYHVGDPLSRASADGLRWKSEQRDIPQPPDWQIWPHEGSNPQPNLDADPTHPLYGENVVFTGNLAMSRQDAKNRAAVVGATTASRVTRQTTVLVVGDGFVASDLRTGRITNKARRALELRERGQHIEVVSEGEFLQMVGGPWPLSV